jgi:hypothetical protein
MRSCRRFSRKPHEQFPHAGDDPAPAPAIPWFPAERTTRRRLTPTFERGCEEVIKWKNTPRVVRVAMFLAAIAAFAVASGAGTRW